ncbi:DUF924 family protein [Paraburkholderia bannensis]|uniref:DUF924 family protein n=1 Tax=Paraburkholderia bannensis TaxID=765414 RepID=UPI002AB7516C|nr:DUF924 family protein [Paraburkholderia bannensis]
MSSDALDPRAREVLDFWFGAPDSAQFGRAQKMWFKKSASFDASLRERFGALLDAACAGELDVWCATPEGALALVIVLDQFSRNCHRDTARAFAADDKALAIARTMVASGDDLRLPTTEHRAFAYLPFEHAESGEAQRESLRLFGELAKHDSQAQGYYDYAVRHAEVIERFGRFPHRNAQLGRASSEAEAAFLLQRGSRF